MSDSSAPISEAVSSVLGRLIDRTRREFSRAASAGKNRLELRQLERDQEHFWVRLGKEAYHLVEAGEIEHPALRKAMGRIDDLQDRIHDCASGPANPLEKDE